MNDIACIYRCKLIQLVDAYQSIKHLIDASYLWKIIKMLSLVCE
jgi:hypothetical protein